MKNLSGLLYNSRALSVFDSTQLKALSDQAAERNKTLGITGYLYYENQKFLQYLEGELETLETLMAIIEKDPRHEVVSVLRTASLSVRKFPNWDMRWLSKPLLVSIRMENILFDFINMLEKDTVERTEENEQKVWEMVDRIRQFNT